MKNIIFLGPPGSGKGTQAKILCKKFNLIHVSTGDIFRYNIKIKSNLGVKIKYYIDKGILVPDSITNNIIKELIIKNKKSNGIIYDGYPRTINQVILFEKNLNCFLINFINIIFLFNISDKVLIDRVFLRKKITNRSDDSNLEIIKKRIKDYNSNIKDIYKYYFNKKNIININAEESIEKISSLLENKIKNIF